jgi:hypothetical protein
MRQYYTSIKKVTFKKKKTANIGKEVEKLESLCAVGQNVKLYNYYGKQYGNFSKNRK